MIRLKQPLLKLNTPSIWSGTTYPESEIKLALERLPRNFLYGSVRYGDKSIPDRLNPPASQHAFHISNMVVENGMLYGDIKLLNNQHGRYLKSLPESEVRFSVACWVGIFGHSMAINIHFISGEAFINLIEHGLWALDRS